MLIVDTIGLLSSIYQYGAVAYVGGGFGVGIHNTLEAAVWGMPVVFGPNYKKFKEARELIECGGGFTISDYEGLSKALNEAFANSHHGVAAADYVKGKIGASDMIIDN